MYKSLKNRNGKAMPVHGLYALQDKNHAGERHEKKQKSSTDYDIIVRSVPDDEDDPHFHKNTSPWLHLIAQESMLRTFRNAGSYFVEDPPRPRFPLV